MSLIRRKPTPPTPPEDDEELISLAEAARLLNLHESTVRQGRAGTSHLTLVRQGTGQRQRISLLRVEVMAHRSSLIAHARRNRGLPHEEGDDHEGNEDSLRQYLRGDHPTLSKEEIQTITERYKFKATSPQEGRKKGRKK